MNLAKQTLVSMESLSEGTLLVSLYGEWDLCTSHQLKRTFEAIDARRDVVLDLRRVEFIDSTTLMHIVHLHRRITSAGQRMETISTGVVRRLFDICALERLVGISRERQAWVDACRREVTTAPRLSSEGQGRAR